MHFTEERIINLKEIQSKLNLEFKDLALLNTALTHKSYVHEQKNKELSHNERLEFFGDAVLKLVVSEFLIKTYPDRDEGELTKIRAALVSDTSLANFSKKQGLGSFLLMSNNERKTGGAKRKSNLANALEALLGALYLDEGLDKVRPIILEFVKPELTRYEEGTLLKDYKSVLQELVQQEGWNLPEYKVTKEEGPDHRKVFWIQVKVGKGLKKYKSEGAGKTKKEAEQRAARQILQQLKKGK
ncbi:MAG: ribonuclease III [Candidatus Margulisbacteria bacterium]|nr:ribonuclease III [Candidatus Margulisiibacteriota bacterium]